MVVVSQPHKKLVGEGSNAKYVKDCTELFLGNEGIEKIRGFEPFVNLEVLWINGNKLQYINNLDQNFRIRVLYAQDNRICSLRGSLQCFKFLETLDVSNNCLRDLDKIIHHLQHFNFLKNLNLKGNPCCEEADYRLSLVFHLPQLHVLDQHVVTPLERSKAKGLIGGDIATLTVAFGKRVPRLLPPSYAMERSLLEQDLAQEAAAAREQKLQEAEAAERKLFEHDPHPPIAPGATLPPSPGLIQCNETFKRQTLQAEQMPLQIVRRANTAASHSGRSRAHSSVQVEGESGKDVYLNFSLKAKPSGTLDSSLPLGSTSSSLKTTARGGRALASIRQQPDWELQQTVIQLP